MDIDCFVNSNPANLELTHNKDYKLVEREFVDGLLVPTDGEIDEAYPVLVYTHKGKPVAWANLELAVGYVQPST